MKGGDYIVRSGTIEMGKVKKTYGQQKKHFSQFSETELDFLKNSLRNIDLNSITISKHLRFKDIKFDLQDIFDTLQSNDLSKMIIEYNQTPKGSFLDKRVLVRSTKSYDVYIDNKIKKCNLCFVISILTCEIITAYYNRAEDNHTSIDMRRYNCNLKIA